jgi:hypothetical protein
MDEAGTWVWIHAGEHRAINLRHVTDVECEQGPVLATRLCLTADWKGCAAPRIPLEKALSCVLD